jgi:hypothetical protein
MIKNWKTVQNGSKWFSAPAARCFASAQAVEPHQNTGKKSDRVFAYQTCLQVLTEDME